MNEARKKGRAAAVALPEVSDDTYSRIRAVCTGAPGINLDKHAAQITEVVALARLRPAGFGYLGRDEAQAPEHP